MKRCLCRVVRAAGPHKANCPMDRRGVRLRHPVENEFTAALNFEHADLFRLPKGAPMGGVVFVAQPYGVFGEGASIAEARAWCAGEGLALDVYPAGTILSWHFPGRTGLAVFRPAGWRRLD